MWTIVTAVVALLGVLLGNILGRRGEHEKWLRAERYEACTRLLDAANAVYVYYQLNAEFDRLFENSLTDPEIIKMFKSIAREGGVQRGIVDLTDDKVDAIAKRGMQNPDVKRIVADAFGQDTTKEIFRRERTLRDQIEHSFESVMLICPAQVRKSAEKLKCTTLNIMNSEAQWDVREAEYLSARTRFRDEIRRLLVGKNRWRISR
jgi:hypothetical protein